jgi:hypothetical protein
MKYVKVKQVKQKVKEIGKRCDKSFLLALDVLIDNKITQASRNSGKFKTLRQDDLI